jgi:gluconolactonase
MQIQELPTEAFEIFARGLDHPECLAFDRQGDLWAGGEAGQIYRITPEGTVRQITQMGGFCGGLAFSPTDQLLVCNPALGIVAVKVSGEFNVFAKAAGAHALICPNYGVFDSKGNYYVTDSGHWKKKNGHLLRFDAEGQGQVIAGPFGYANGLALSADERSLFMVESDSNSILRFVVGDEGSLSPAEVYASDCGRFPDGLVLDAAGNLYVCCYASDEIWRISPSRQKSLFAYDPWGILLGSPTNMAFGGENLDSLYVANLARTTISRAAVPARGQPLIHQRPGKPW